jgi:hypothetical protein
MTMMTLLPLLAPLPLLVAPLPLVARLLPPLVARLPLLRVALLPLVARWPPLRRVARVSFRRPVALRSSPSPLAPCSWLVVSWCAGSFGNS